MQRRQMLSYCRPSAILLLATTTSAAYASGFRPRPCTQPSIVVGRFMAVHCTADRQLDGNSGFEEEVAADTSFEEEVAADTSVSRRSPAPLTVALQAMHITAAASALTAPIGEGPMDKAVAALWDAFERAAIVTHDPMFEANVAVLAFVAWIAFFESLHLWWPNAIEVSSPCPRAQRAFTCLAVCHACVSDRIGSPKARLPCMRSPA
jgi:hypothetical protein